MKNDLVISGLGVISSLGQGQDLFKQNLINGRSFFKVMNREGRQKESAFVGAEIENLCSPENYSTLFRTVFLSSRVAALTLAEAYHDAKADAVSPSRIGLVIGGSNLSQREHLLLQLKHQDSPFYIRPQYGMSFLDSDISGVCTELFTINGPSYTVGGASASGQLAVIRAIEAVQSGEVDICFALGALMDVSYLELYAFQALGALASDEKIAPDALSRPFDRLHQGFVYGENCGAVVIERYAHAVRRGVVPRARIKGWAISMDGHRNPEPSLKGEIHVIDEALKRANISRDQIDYINPHGTGSELGDTIELEALKTCKLNHAYINTTKSITGHGLSAAGCVELIATVLQMEEGILHPSLNLENPIDETFNWVKNTSIRHKIQSALSLSLGFGGINTAICLQTMD